MSTKVMQTFKTSTSEQSSVRLAITMHFKTYTSICFEKHRFELTTKTIEEDDLVTHCRVDLHVHTISMNFFGIQVNPKQS